MRFIVRNDKTKMVTGGRDNLNGRDMWKVVNDYLTIPVDGADQIIREATKGMTKEEKDNYKWDGNKRLMNYKGEFATGLLPMIVELVKDYDIHVEFEDRRNNLPIFQRELDFTTPFFELYKHQRKLVQSVKRSVLEGFSNNLYFPRGIWKAATNAGKTAAFGCLVNNVVNANALLLVGEQQLFEQHIKFYRRWFGNSVGIIGSIAPEGKKTKKYMYQPGSPITIAMVDTLCSRMKKDENIRYALRHKYNILGVDECHDFSNSTAATVIEAVDAGIKLFMSGTPLDVSPNSRMDLIGMSGKVLHSVSKRYLMDSGFSMTPAILIYKNPARLKLDTNYPNEYDRLIMKSPERADLIADLIAERIGKKVMVTFFEKEHGYFMYEHFINKYPQYFDLVDIVHGTDSDRSEKVDRFINQKARIAFTSTIMRQGIDVPDINTIIFGQGEKDPKDLSQFMGRGERLDGRNTKFEWIDFYDQGSYTAPHSQQRIAFYIKEELEVKFMYNHNEDGTPRTSA